MFQLGTTVMNGSLHFSSEDLPPRAFTNYSYLFRPSRASYNGEKQKASHQEAWVPLLALPWASWLLGISDNSLRGRIEYCSGSQTWAILESPKEVGKKCKNPVLLPFQWVWASVGLFVYWIFFFFKYCFCFMFWLFAYEACGISLTRDWTHTPCSGRQTLNHWTTREVPGLMCSFLAFWMIVMMFQSLPIHLI